MLELLLTTDLSLEQKHYALALGSLLVDAAEEPAEPAPVSAESYIDREVLAELYRYLPPSSCAAILAQFRGTAQELLEAASAAVSTEQPEALARTAHSMIGTAGAVGMVLLAQEARAIVLALRQGDWACAAALTAKLPGLYEASSVALEATVAELSSSIA